ncbi:EVE domain-containing protein [Dehalococcoidales bacterium]|nr:EVE domain-containing protein [Dehalococcoidales bacterium]
MNYYLTKSNPNTFRLQDYLQVISPTEESRWTVCKDATPGDTLFIGLAGKEAGIYARATITSDPIFRGDDPDFWIDPKEAAKPR